MNEDAEEDGELMEEGQDTGRIGDGVRGRRDPGQPTAEEKREHSIACLIEVGVQSA